MNSAVKAALASVLVIDDHPMVSRLVCEELAEAGYGATSAFDAAKPATRYETGQWTWQS